MVDDWRIRNREKYNLRRKELRAKRKQEKMKGKFCLLCEIRMVGRSYHARLYCNDCTRRFPIKVRQHKWRRYWYAKFPPKKEKKLSFKELHNMNY